MDSAAEGEKTLRGLVALVRHARTFGHRTRTVSWAEVHHLRTLGSRYLSQAYGDRSPKLEAFIRLTEDAFAPVRPLPGFMAKRELIEGEEVLVIHEGDTEDRVGCLNKLDLNNALRILIEAAVWLRTNIRQQGVGIAKGTMADNSSDHENEARRILSHPGSLEELQYERDRLKTLRFKLLEANPTLRNPEVKEILPDLLEPGSPLPGVSSPTITRGAVLRLRDLDRRLALYEQAIEQKQQVAMAGRGPGTEPSQAVVAKDGSGTNRGTVNLPGSRDSVKRMLKADIVQTWMAKEGYTNETLAQKLKTSTRVVSSMLNNGDYHGRRAVTKLANLMGRDSVDLYLP